MKPCIHKCLDQTAAETEFAVSNRLEVREIFEIGNHYCKSLDRKLASVGYRRDVLAKKPEKKQNRIE